MGVRGLRALLKVVLAGAIGAEWGQAAAGFFVPKLLQTTGLGLKLRPAFCDFNTFLGTQMILPAVLWVSEGCGHYSKLS